MSTHAEPSLAAGAAAYVAPIRSGPSTVGTYLRVRQGRVGARSVVQLVEVRVLPVVLP